MWFVCINATCAAGTFLRARVSARRAGECTTGAGHRDFASTARNEHVELDPTWPFVGPGRRDHDRHEHEDNQLEDNEHDPHPPIGPGSYDPPRPTTMGRSNPPGRRDVSFLSAER